MLWSCEAAYFHIAPAAKAAPVSIQDLTKRPLVLPDASWADTDPTRRQLSARAQRLVTRWCPTSRWRPVLLRCRSRRAGVAGAVASVPIAEAFGYAKKLTWVSLDPPLIETFAVITRDPTSLSPATEAMIGLINQHMRMLHREYESA
jgi:LysR family transcriptional regulator, cyn operon transcriptional activator